MTLLLKNVWRNVLRNSQVAQTFSARSLSSSISELTTLKSPDSVMASIKSADSPAAVLATVQQLLPQMNHTHLLEAFRTLSKIHRATKAQTETYTLVTDPGFNILCEHLKKHARHLGVDECIEVTKVLCYFNVPVDSLIVQNVLQLVRCQINELSIRQVMFLDFLISKFDTRNHLVDVLKVALPLVFQIHLPLEIDNDDLPLLRDMLSYACTHDLPDRCINNIVTGLLLHDQAMTPQIAKAVIWSLCEVNCTQEVHPTRVQLLHISFDIMTQFIDQLPYEDVLRPAAKVKGRILEKHLEFYHEQFMDAVAGYVVRNVHEFDKALLVARVLSRIAHTHLGLTEHICQLAASNPETLANARTNQLFSFINCLSNSNYFPDPEQWAEIRRQISLNPILDAKNAGLPWTKVALELASLGHYEEKLLDRIFTQDFLDGFLARGDSQLDYLQLLTLQAAVKTFHNDKYELPQEIVEKAKGYYPIHGLSVPLESTLAKGLGGPEYVVRNVELPSGIVADVVLCLKNGYPVKLPTPNPELIKMPIEELKLPEGGIVVCILNFNQGCFSMNSNRLRGTFRLILDILEKQGYAAVSINIHEWMNSPAHEQTPYLLREVGYKCGEIGMKLCVT